MIDVCMHTITVVNVAEDNVEETNVIGTYQTISATQYICTQCRQVFEIPQSTSAYQHEDH